MKKHFFTVLALSSGIIAVSNCPSLAFPEINITLAPLCLAAAVKQARPNFWTQVEAPRILITSPSPKSFVSKMPIISPQAGTDLKMIKAPDLSIDYKMIVKIPDLETAK
jgi:hypothetical protein